MDDFGVKYIGKEHIMHLIKTLKEHYEVEEEWGGHRYLGITLDWDYKNCKLHLFVPKYVEHALAQFNHHQHTIATYRATVQCAKPEPAACYSD